MTAPADDDGPRPLGAVLCGLGTAQADVLVPNAEIAERLGVGDDWILTRTGIAERRRAGVETSTADLAVRAAAAALKSSGTDTVDVVVLATATPDHRMPGTAPEVATRLGLHTIAAFDIAAACTGLPYALQVAKGFVADGAAQRVLVITVDRLSHLTDPDDRTTAALFGDGAAALVVRRGQVGEPGAVGPVILGADGRHVDALVVPHGQFMRMRGREVFHHAVIRMSQATEQAAAAAGWNLSDVDRFVPHQANSRITAAVSRRLHLDGGRVLESITHLGNTSASSILFALAQAAGDGSLRPGHRVLLAAFGAGLTWGATTLTWPDVPCVADRPDPSQPLEAAR
ncbi:beta-ketoacyl-ACP synthase 3 [Streptomyces spectabilis]|uniref:3-oxoacyl-[acyl-carrier-protein] synthase-3 n=1 Tax=Streptomyces spectabilis TaxID=68270 RepID=A0A7W8EZP3_STRST|nr:beta-ketoacyl-ACP synthase 3 [Streptomyces spectabilis]MBB5108970.1 3-oxoacyl-[acyl-carrier-protein] synthase-3 [Streptomyces spectabilis]GGV50430.1 3-oxoacyl-[acyl-carrier-protein] synthase 3 [Streptomyces spectabilis]